MNLSNKVGKKLPTEIDDSRQSRVSEGEIIEFIVIFIGRLTRLIEGFGTISRMEIVDLYPKLRI